MRSFQADDSISGQEREAYRKVLEALAELRSNDPDLAIRLTDTPVRALGNRTLEQVIQSGEVDKALRYLQSISGGQNG